CGYRGDGTDRCRCSPARLEQYRARISGPLLDRFDLHVEVPRVPFEEPAPGTDCGETARARPLILAARERQLARAGRLNARLADGTLWTTARPSRDATAVLKRAVNQWQLSMRSGVRIMKVARTIADLDGRDIVLEGDVAEALQLRWLDR